MDQLFDHIAPCCILGALAIGTYVRGNQFGNITMTSPYMHKFFKLDDDEVFYLGKKGAYVIQTAKCIFFITLFHNYLLIFLF